MVNLGEIASFGRGKSVAHRGIRLRHLRRNAGSPASRFAWKKKIRRQLELLLSIGCAGRRREATGERGGVNAEERSREIRNRLAWLVMRGYSNNSALNLEG